MGIEHFHNKIFGYSDDTYFSIVRDVVKRFPSGSHFVEVGALLGKSSSYIAVEIANSGKNINYDVIDHWLGSSEHTEVEELQDIDMFDTPNFDKIAQNGVKADALIPVFPSLTFPNHYSTTPSPANSSLVLKHLSVLPTI